MSFRRWVCRFAALFTDPSPLGLLLSEAVYGEKREAWGKYGWAILFFNLLLIAILIRLGFLYYG